MPRRSKPLPDATPEHNDEQGRDPISSVLDLQVVALAARHIATHLQSCDMSPLLDDEGRSIARRLAKMAGIDQEIGAMLREPGKG